LISRVEKWYTTQCYMQYLTLPLLYYSREVNTTTWGAGQSFLTDTELIFSYSRDHYSLQQPLFTNVSPLDLLESITVFLLLHKVGACARHCVSSFTLHTLFAYFSLCPTSVYCTSTHDCIRLLINTTQERVFSLHNIQTSSPLSSAWLLLQRLLSSRLDWH